MIFDLICGPLQKTQNMLEPDKCPVRERKISVGQRTKLLTRGYVALRKNIFHIQLTANSTMRQRKRKRSDLDDSSSSSYLACNNAVQ